MYLFFIFFPSSVTMLWDRCGCHRAPSVGLVFTDGYRLQPPLQIPGWRLNGTPMAQRLAKNVFGHKGFIGRDGNGMRIISGLVHPPRS